MNINNIDLKTAAAELEKTADDLRNAPSLSLDSFDSSRTMFIMVDIVNGFINEGAMSAPVIRDIIQPVCTLLEKCSGKGIKSAAFADCHGENCAEFSDFPPHCIKGSSESEIVDEIKKIGGYTLIPKNSTNGFHEDRFSKLLSENSSADTFIVVGDCTDICVMQFCLTLKTYFTAADKKCRIVIPVNCIETYDAPYHNGSFSNLAAVRLMSGSAVEFVKEII